MGDDIPRHTRDMQPVRHYGWCHLHLTSYGLLLFRVQRFVEARKGPQRHDFSRHPDRHLGKGWPRVPVLVVSDERLLGARHFFQDTFKPLHVLRAGEIKVTRLKVAKGAVSVRKVISEHRLATSM